MTDQIQNEREEFEEPEVSEFSEKLCQKAWELEEQGLYSQAAEAYLLAGLDGNPKGTYGYARSLYLGGNSKSDLRTAHNIFRLLRKKGYKRSPGFFLGLYEEQGLLREPDYEKAIQYYTEAAEDGDFRSFRQLGRIYTEGKITEENPELAYYNFMMAAAIGDPISVTNMAAFVEEGYGVEKNPEWAVTLYRLAAEAGEENAIEALERLGVSADPEE